MISVPRMKAMVNLFHGIYNDIWREPLKSNLVSVRMDKAREF